MSKRVLIGVGVVLAVLVVGGLAVWLWPRNGPNRSGLEGGAIVSIDAFVFEDGRFVPQGRLSSLTPGFNDQLGRAVAIDGDTAVVGSPFDNLGPGLADAGSVSVFVRNGDSWSESLKLTADGLLVTEIAPGADLEQHVLAQADIPLKVAPDLKPMAPQLFSPEPMRLELADA